MMKRQFLAVGNNNSVWLWLNAIVPEDIKLGLWEEKNQFLQYFLS